MTLRIAKTAAASPSHTFEVDETATDSTAPVTVNVTDAAGAAIVGSPFTATSAGAGTGKYTFALPPQAALCILTLDWSATIAGAAIVETDTVEICGGYLFTLREGRGSDKSLTDTRTYPTADLIVKRSEVEDECEWICDRAFTPRYRRVILDGSGESDLLLPDGGDEIVSGVTLRGVRLIRSAKVAPRFGQPFASLDAGALASLVVTSSGMLRRADGRIWTEGDQNVILEYEYGNDFVPPLLKQGMLHRFRNRLNINKSGIPDRAATYTAAEGGGTYRLTLPDAYRTGVPEVDALYARYSRRVSSDANAQGGRSQPASRTLTYEPQHNSMFHRGGLR